MPMRGLTDTIGPRLHGRLGLWRLVDGKLQLITYKRNQIQYSWGHIAARCIGQGLPAYRIQGMYVEFCNLADPADVVTPPAYGRDEGLSYYSDLALTSGSDYLRVPMVQTPMLSIAAGFEDFFGTGAGNKLTFFAFTQGTAGVNGKTFSDSVNSKIIGAALVATPVWADHTQDVIFARTYLSVDDQVVKEASGQFAITWDITFE